MKITVDTLGGQFSFECAPTERILYAALSHGLSVPYECATGTCGTCRGRVHAGGVDVEWDAAPRAGPVQRPQAPGQVGRASEGGNGDGAAQAQRVRARGGVCHRLPPTLM